MPPRTSTILVHYNRHPHLASPSPLEPARRCSIKSSFARGGLVEVCTCRCYCRTIEEPATTDGQKISTSERKLVHERWIFTVCLFLTDAKVHWFFVVAAPAQPLQPPRDLHRFSDVETKGKMN
nr:hypothetical protein Iba_chr11dCG13510 [Ipomoea batatas]